MMRTDESEAAPGHSAAVLLREKKAELERGRQALAAREALIAPQRAALDEEWECNLKPLEADVKRAEKALKQAQAQLAHWESLISQESTLFREMATLQAKDLSRDLVGRGRLCNVLSDLNEIDRWKPILPRRREEVAEEARRFAELCQEKEQRFAAYDAKAEPVGAQQVALEAERARLDALAEGLKKADEGLSALGL